MDLANHIDGEPEALRVIRDAMHSSDDDGVRALLGMAISHGNKTADLFSKIVGLVLVALEHSNMEVSHGRYIAP